MKEILKELGFENMTGPLWKHKDNNVIISINDDDLPVDIVNKLIDIGVGETQALIKSAIGIK